jgi:hypothetical protein
MTRNFDSNTPLFQLSVGDLLQLMEERKQPEPVKVIDMTSEKYVYHLDGLARLFGCSKTTANRIKQSGKIDKAITQIGNLIIVDADKAIQLAGAVNGKHSKK